MTRSLICSGMLAITLAVARPPGAFAAEPQAPGLGIFEGRGDVGLVLHPGSTEFDPAAGAYAVAGSGENMWGVRDAFQFAWKKATGDLSLTADVAFVGQGTDPHRKACLVIRQDLTPGSAYVDVAIHGDGLTSLQFRDADGEATHEVQANALAPRRLRIEKRGGYVRMALATETGAEPTFAGPAVRISFQEPFYVGIGVCSHNKDVTEKATFSAVALASPLPAPSGPPTLYSCLETQAMSSTDRRVVYLTPTRIEAPNWLRDGRRWSSTAAAGSTRSPPREGCPSRSTPEP